MKCVNCGTVGRKDKEVFQCTYCKQWYCDPYCTIYHLGRCDKDPTPIQFEKKEIEK